MSSEPKNQEFLYDEIMAKLDLIQDDQVIKDSQKLVDQHEQSGIVDEALFDEIKNSQPEFKPTRPKSPIRRILDEEEDENSEEEEQLTRTAAVYEDEPEDIEDYESVDERDEIYRDLKNTVGKMAFKSIVFFLLSVVAVYLFIAGFKPALFGNNIDGALYQVAHLAIDTACIVFSVSIFTHGLSLLLRARADTDTLLSLLCAALIILRITNLIKPDLVPYQLNLEPMLTIGLFYNVSAKKKIAGNIKRNFKSSASNGDKLTISIPASCEANNALILETGEGSDVVYAHRTGLVSKFIDHSYGDYDWDRNIQHFLFGSLLFIAAGVVALIQLADLGSALLFPAAAISLSLPFFSRYFYACSIWKVGKKIRKKGGILTSAESAVEFKDSELLVVEEDELLGDDAVLLQGVKAIGDMQIDTLITYIAALFSKGNSPLRPLFMKMIDENSVKLPIVHDRYYHEGMGYSCLIQSKMFLVGNAALMKHFNIEFPEQYANLKWSGTKYPVFVAYHKSPVGVFITSYEPNKNTLEGLLLAEEHHIGVAVSAGDFNLDYNLLKELYPMVDCKSFLHLLTKTTTKFCVPQLERREKSGDLISSKSGFKGIMAALVGAKKLLVALKINMVIRILYTIISLALIFFIALNGYSANTALQILLFQFIWLAPVCAICTFCK